MSPRRFLFRLKSYREEETVFRSVCVAGFSIRLRSDREHDAF
jgi:hypothetical protein